MKTLDTVMPGKYGVQIKDALKEASDTVHAIMVWPDKTPDNNAAVEPMDYFWVECTPEEAKENIVPKLSAETLLDYRNISEIPNRPPSELSYMVGKQFFLVSRDGQNIEPLPWYFPFSGQWNAYCPILCMRKRKIYEISDLQDLIVETINYVDWNKEDTI